MHGDDPVRGDVRVGGDIDRDAKPAHAVCHCLSILAPQRTLQDNNTLTECCKHYGAICDGLASGDDDICLCVAREGLQLGGAEGHNLDEFRQWHERRSMISAPPPLTNDNTAQL